MIQNGKAILFAMGLMLFILLSAISYYVIFGLVIIVAVLIMGKIGAMGQDEYKRSQRESREPEIKRARRLK